MSRKHLFDEQKNVKKVLAGLFIACALLFISDFFIHKHAHHSWEEWPGFYAVYGFLSCVILVLIAKYILRPLVIRDEDYYD